MATIPSFEKLILEVHQSLGLGRFQSSVKDKFADLGFSMSTQTEKVEEVIKAIFTALDMNEQACHDATSNIVEWANFHKALELHTWTSNADQRQVLWHLLGYSYAPALGRRVAAWNMEGAFDRGMPGGRFWFLPNVDAATGSVQLPVPQVLDWLLDLLSRPMDHARDQFGGERTKRADNHESIERNLYNWRNGRLPELEKINSYFPDDANIDFHGIFEPEAELSDTQKFEAALAFVRDIKQLSPDGLRDQIPMTQPGRIEAVIDGSAPEGEKLEFVRLIHERFAKPSMRVIRQRLMVASMVQDGYRRLLKVLCSGVDECCADPLTNKLLQPIAMFQVSYNLTIAAWKNCGTEADENVWFESHLTEWDQATTFLSILPSRRETAYKDLGALLSRRFAKLHEGAPLEDLWGWDEKSTLSVAESKLRALKFDAEENLSHINLVERVRRSSPWRALQAESNYWVVSQVAQSKMIPPQGRRLAVERMRELATSPSQVLGATVIELGFLLNCRRQERPKDVQQRVDALLTSAHNNPDRVQWSAPLLQYEAKHCLAQNDFEGAAKLFRQSLESCSERSFGPLRGEIARDTFATEVADQKLIPGNHEKYYRNMVAYGIFEKAGHTLEDTAAWVADHFWNDLYKPYPGIERRNPASAAEAESFIKESLPLIFEANWDGLNAWMKRHSKTFQKSTLREVGGNTVLMAWLKLKHALNGAQPNLKMMAPPSLYSELVKLETGLENWSYAIELLAASWPRQVNISDFKGQTPLMLVADAGEEGLVSQFLAVGADVNAQDYKGRTALHAAVAGRSEQCVAAILEHKPAVSLSTVPDRQSFLHTAVRMGHPGIVRMILEHYPNLKFAKNSHAQTPAILLDEILTNLPGFQEEMAKHRRQTGSLADFEAIKSSLRDGTTIH